MGYTNTLRHGDWDLLVVLDACRADIFEEVYKDYFKKGTFTRETSPASHTMDWLAQVWPESYDVVYVSANPYINSSTEITDAYGNTYDAKQHFPVIIDVWEKGWDEELGTVRPEKVNEMYHRVNQVLGNDKKRVILHYIQPHEPFIGEKYKKYRIGQAQSSFTAKPPRKGVKHRAKKFAAKAVKNVFGVVAVWRLSGWLGNEGNQYARIHRAEGWAGVRAAYTENLRLVLEQVVKITENYPGKVIITADHGDFLGEHGLFGHPEKVKEKENTEVPWLLIE